MKIAICDDETVYIEKLSAFLKEYFLSHPTVAYSLSCFFHGEELLEDVDKNGEYDLYFLDIIMPGMNGITLGRNLRHQGYTGSIIYLTSSPEYAIDSYRVRAHDYLLKPLDSEILFSTLNTLIPTLCQKQEAFTIVKTKDSKIKISLHHLLYAQLSNRVIHYHLLDGTIIRSLYLRTGFTDAVSAVLKHPDFFLAGAGMVANLSYLTRMENNNAIFCNKYVVPLGLKGFRSLKAAWVDYCINKEI